MSNRALMIALAVSLALNLFAVAAGVTVWVTREVAEERVEDARSSRVRVPLMEVIDTIEPARREPVRAELRAAALMVISVEALESLLSRGRRALRASLAETARGEGVL